MTALIPILLVAFALGQLTRISPSPGVQLYFQDLLLGAIFIYTVFVRHPAGAFRSFRLAKPIFAFALAGLASLVYSLSIFPPSQTLVGSLYWVRWIVYGSLYFFLVGELRKTKTIRLFHRSFTVTELLQLTGLSLAFFGLLQYFFFPDTRALSLLGWDDHYYRLIGTLLDPGFLGLILALTALISLAAQTPAGFKVLTAGLSLAALFLTYSRASYLAFLAGFLVLKLREKRLKAALVFPAVFLLILALLPKHLSEGTNLLRTYSLVDRWETWRESVVIFRASPVFGVGFNNLRFAKVKLGLAGQDWQTSHSLSGIENSYLFVLAASGIAGLAALIWLLVSGLRLGLTGKNRGSRSGLFLASCSAIFIHALFNNSLFYPWVMIWFWLITAEAETAIPQKKLQAQ